jgi:MATE family multidrug resistance protein
MKHTYSNKAVWKIAAPMILSSVSIPLLGIVDTAVMGHLDGAWYLASVAAGTVVFNILFMGLNFLRMGTTGIAAQAFGAGDEREITACLLQPLVIAVILIVAMLALRNPIMELALVLLGPSDIVASFSRVYYDIRIWSAPAMLINLVILGWLLGMQNARGPLAMVLVVNLSNIVLDIWFVLGLGMNVRGVAIASVIAEYAGLAVGIWLIWRYFQTHSFCWPDNTLLRPDRYKRLFMINSSLFLRSAALMFTFAFITAQGARLGDTILAANAVLMNFLYFFAYATDGLANAAEALTGKAAGARDMKGLESAVRITLFWTVLFTGGFTLLYGGAGKAIIYLLTDIHEVRELAISYLPWLVALPAAAAICFLYDGVYIGTTRSREMMIVMVSSVGCVFLPTWFLLRETGNHALWAALLAFMAVRSIGMHVWYRRMLRDGRLISPAATN